MFGLSRQVQQALAFLLLVLAFGMGVMYSRWQQAPEEEAVFLLETVETKEATLDKEEPLPELKVHVAGAVLRPGVYSFQDKSRVEDVLVVAQPLPEADLDALNLAAYLRDEQRIYVPYRESGGGGTGRSPIKNEPVGEPGKVNINTADLEELMTLPGIGPALAQRIVDYRNTQGSFRSLEELKNVSGIGDKIYQNIEHLITY